MYLDDFNFVAHDKGESRHGVDLYGVCVLPDGRDKLELFWERAARVGITPCEYEIPEDPDASFEIKIEIDSTLNNHTNLCE